MPAKFPTLVLSILAMTVVSAPVAADCAWDAAPSFPGGARKEAVAVNQGGTLVAIGGRPFIGENASVHYLLPGGTAWQIGASLEPAISDAGAGIDALGRIVVFGGWIWDDTGGGFTPVSNGFFYDIFTGIGGGIASIPVARNRALFTCATDTDDPQHRFYMVGGLDVDQTTQAYVDRYDTVNDLWAPLAPLPEPRTNAAAVYDGVGNILVIGGANASGFVQSTVYAYDTVGGTWSAIADQPGALDEQAAVLGANGLVYVVGGSAGASETDAVFIYDPSTGGWSVGPDLITPRKDGRHRLGRRRLHLCHGRQRQHRHEYRRTLLYRRARPRRRLQQQRHPGRM